MKYNLFISFTKNQNNTISEIINSNIISGENMLISSSNNIPECFDKKNVLYINKINSIPRAFKNILFRTQKIEAYSFLQEKFSSSTQVEIIIPHFINLISNHIFLKREELFPKSNTIFSIYPDGIALYFPQKADFQNIRTSHYLPVLYRYFMGKITGLQYRMFTGSIIDPFKTINNIYTYFPAITPMYSADSKILIPTKTKNCMGNNVLILGAAKNYKLDEEYFLDLKQYISELFSSEVSVYFKPHPSLISNAVKSPLELIYNSLIVINDDSPAENMIDQLNIGSVITLSFFSSTLLHLKNVYGDSIGCYIYKADTFIRDRNENDLVDLQNIMDKLNIKLVTGDMKR
jgi:hypothetical protein